MGHPQKAGRSASKKERNEKEMKRNEKRKNFHKTLEQAEDYSEITHMRVRNTSVEIYQQLGKRHTTHPPKSQNRASSRINISSQVFIS